MPSSIGFGDLDGSAWETTFRAEFSSDVEQTKCMVNLLMVVVDIGSNRSSDVDNVENRIYHENNRISYCGQILDNLWVTPDLSTGSSAEMRK